jgi:polyhydroxybutyrate depolymerase
VQGGGYGWEWWETDSIDYDFFEAMMEDLGSHACVDNRRVFASGTSNGAYFAEMVGCLHGDWIAGVGASAGGMPVNPAACASPATAFLMHGTMDTVVPISEGIEGRDAWLQINGCSATTEDAGQGCVRYPDCSTGHTVVWCQHGGGHPGADPNALGLSEAMIDEFQALQ